MVSAKWNTRRPTSARSQPSPFRLNKWYLDCVSETGQTFIAYSAELAWRSLGLSYASCLEFDGIHRPFTRTTPGLGGLPTLAPGEITWASEGASCSGCWRPVFTHPISPVNLYQDDAGSVVWHCLAPLSQVSISREGAEFAGLGYVEHLEITVAPWRLPIEELHWGRFLAPNTYAVWIEWRGLHALNLVYVNGQRVESVNVSSSTLSWEGGSLALSEQVFLRNGPLVNTALSNIPGARSLFPKSVLDTDERKWRSRGELSLDGETHSGWAIHEVVRLGSDEHE